MPRIAILGATGAVGAVIRECLEERNFPASDLVFLASERSAGRRIRYAGEEIEVRAVSPEAFDDVEIAIFSAGATRSREWAPIAIERGAVVIDNSSAFRMRDDVPLVVSEVNPHALHGHAGLIANPNCSTMQLMPILRPLRDAAGLERVTIATYQSVSGTGLKAIEGLRAETKAALADEVVRASVYPKQIAFNVLGFAGSFVGDDGYTDEELKLVNETRKILELPDLRVSPHCSRVPVVYGHSEAVWVETKDELSPAAFRDLLAEAPGVVDADDPATFTFPTAITAAGSDDVFVGRIRRDLGDPRTLAFWVVGDNLRKGAATNTVQIAEILVRDGLLTRTSV
jgi:aspartate-semialdehyde dehydrogenase